jgi:phage FluMu protein Com
MKATKYFGLLIVLFLLAGSSIASEDTHVMAVSTLAGANDVLVELMIEVMDRGDKEPTIVSEFGELRKDNLIKQVRDVLGASEIKVCEDLESLAKGAVYLNVNILLVTNQKDTTKPCVAVVTTEALQYVTLLRDDDIYTLARTWPVIPMGLRTRQVLFGQRDEISQKIRKEIGHQVQTFIQDYLEVRSSTDSEVDEKSGIPKAFKKKNMWLKCRNPRCKNEFQMSMYQYYKTIEDYLKEHPQTQIAPGLECEKCRKPSAYAAAKCAKCGLVFEKGWKRGDFEDRCPKCKYSGIEDARRKTRQARDKSDAKRPGR